MKNIGLVNPKYIAELRCNVLFHMEVNRLFIRLLVSFQLGLFLIKNAILINYIKAF